MRERALLGGPRLCVFTDFWTPGRGGGRGTAEGGEHADERVRGRRGRQLREMEEIKVEWNRH